MNTATRTDFDTELRRHNECCAACVIQFRDRILDIGCGTGQTTRQAACTARAGSALGVDVSGPSIERARQLARTAKLRNGKPTGATSGIIAIRRSLDAVGALIADAAEELNPFSLADPPAVTEMLEAAGFTDIAFADISEPVYYGVDVAAALDWVRGFRCTSEALKRLDPAAADRAVRRLRETLAAHTSEGGVRFNSRAWIITARRRGDQIRQPKRSRPSRGPLSCSTQAIGGSHHFPSRISSLSPTEGSRASIM